mgnify:CR=1 FL=1
MGATIVTICGDAFPGTKGVVRCHLQPGHEGQHATTVETAEAFFRVTWDYTAILKSDERPCLPVIAKEG